MKTDKRAWLVIKVALSKAARCGSASCTPPGVVIQGFMCGDGDPGVPVLLSETVLLMSILSARGQRPVMSC